MTTHDTRKPFKRYTEKDFEQAYTEAKNAYYGGEAIMTDDCFDTLENQFKKYFPNNPLLEKVGVVE